MHYLNFLYYQPIIVTFLAMLKIFDSFQKKKVEFTPIDSKCVKIYVCGPSLIFLFGFCERFILKLSMCVILPM